jgi:hypothetical protein
MVEVEDLKKVYKGWNPDNILCDGNENVAIELEFIKIKTLDRIANALENIAYGNDEHSEHSLNASLKCILVDVEKIAENVAEFNDNFFRQPIQIKEVDK